MLDDQALLPTLYEVWPGDPGAKPDDNPPFPMNVRERFQFYDAVFFYERRTTTGFFCFNPEDGAAPLLRSAWRLRAEFAENVLVRLDRGRRRHPSRAHAVAQGATASAPLQISDRVAWDNRIFIPLIRKEIRRRHADGLPKLPRSGPRDKGGRAVPHDPPRNLAELIANLALEAGIPAGKQPSWKTVAKTLAKFDHLEMIPLHQLVDGRSIADHPTRTDPLVEQIALRVIEADFATRKFESVSGTVVRVKNSLNDVNQLLPPDGQLPAIGREAIENLISTLPGMDLCEAKDGRRKARAVYSIVGKRPKPIEPMSEVEFDWHKIDLVTTYPDQAKYLELLAGIPVPRLWIIAGVDTATGWPAGHAWSIGDPNAGSIMRGFSRVCRYKPSYSHLGAQGEWLAHGLPRIMRLDRAKANMAHDVIRAAGNLGIELVFDRGDYPEGRPYIERFFGTVETDFISKLDGALGHNVLVRPSQPAHPSQMLAIDELDDRFIRWVCDRYANGTARTRTHSPRTAWLEYEKENPGWSPDTALSEEELDRELRVSIIRTASKEGVVWKDVWYNGPAVGKIRSDQHAHSRGNPKLEMRMHFDDIANVIVFDPHPQTGGWQKYPEVECLYRDYAPGKSMDVHEIIHNAAHLAKKQRQKITEQLLAETYVAVTRRAVEKIMRRGPTTRTVGAAARLGGLTAAEGATPFPRSQGPELSAEELRHSLRAADGTVGPEPAPSDGSQSDPAAARLRLMSGWLGSPAPEPQAAPHGSTLTTDPNVNDNEQ